MDSAKLQVDPADSAKPLADPMDSAKLQADPTYLHSLMMHSLHVPVVFHGLIQDWPASRWKPKDLASILGNKKVKIRIGLTEAKQWTSTQWETSCSYETTTLANLCEWLEPYGPTSFNDSLPDKPQDGHDKNPLLQYNPEEHWCYMDYKYMAELFQGHPDILQEIRWGVFGFPDRDGHQSTIWIGSQGATTPGHYDTYGCNLVAQIFGRKKWHLFPPSQSDALYQTRIPYEESSVFSPINISKPDLNKYPQFSTATPYVVTLEPGDTLFVPSHWWHFVETVDTSISVNTWIEKDTDHKDRFYEAITRALVSEILPPLKTHKMTKWLNPTEEIHDTTTNMKYLKRAIENLIQHQRQMENHDNSESLLASSSSLDKKILTDLHGVTDESKHSSYSQIVNYSHPHVVNLLSLQENVKSNTGVRHDEFESSLEGMTSPNFHVKRRKCSSTSQTSDNRNWFPDFITVVPCLGQVYKRQHLQSNTDYCGNCQRNSSHSNIEGEPLFGASVGCGVQHSETTGTHIENKMDTENENHSIDNETDGIQELLLQSIINPEVISCVARIMCKKINEKSSFLY